MNKTRSGVVLGLSGGMDSTTVLALAVNQFGDENVVTCGFDYGQKHKVELENAARIAAWYGVPYQVIQLPRIFAGAGSTLVDDDAPVEHVGSYEELQERYGAQPTVVPNRNMNFIAMLITVALTRGLNRVYLGVHAGDANNFHYPDCRPAFIGAMTAACEIANGDEVQLVAPFNSKTKGEIVLEAAELGAPLHLTHSCYNGQQPACGTCATCLERLGAFLEAGYSDPIEYAIHPDWYVAAFGDLSAAFEGFKRASQGKTAKQMRLF